MSSATLAAARGKSRSGLGLLLSSLVGKLMMAGVQALRYIPHPVPQRAIREFLLSSVGIAAVCLAFCSQPSVANGAGSTASQARGFPFNAVAEDALVVKK